MRLTTLPLALLALAPASSFAQTWRTLDVSRQARDNEELRVHVQYAAGRFDLRASDEPYLYTMHLRYDEDRVKPLDQFDAGKHSLSIGVGDHSTHWTGNKSEGEQPEMRLTLARTVPIDLSLTLGATQTTVDLGGLTLRDLRIESGAAEATVDFSAPNRTNMSTVEVQAGAASITMRNIANARAASIDVKGGVGALDLGFGGNWTSDIEARLAVAVGKVMIRVPRDVGIRLEMQRLLASFANDGLEKRDGVYYSDNWDTAKYHLRIHVDATFGAVAIDHSGPIVDY
jgi:hypothetical protein